MNSVAEAGVVPDMRARIKALVPAERRVAIRRMLARVKVLSSYGYDARRFLWASSAE